MLAHSVFEMESTENLMHFEFVQVLRAYPYTFMELYTIHVCITPNFIDSIL